MTKNPLRRDLRYITIEGSTYCVMQGLGESTLQAFLVALGYASHIAGWVSTLPLFLGAILQNMAPALISKVGSLRRFSVMSVALQAAAFLPLVWAAWTRTLPLWAIYASVALYWAGGYSTGASWNTWIETVVPRAIRPRYFARRSAFCNLLSWGCLLAVGAILKKADEYNLTLPTFGLCFLAAGVSRGIGAYVMSRQSEKEPLPEGFTVLGFLPALKVLRTSPEGALLLYLLAAQASLQIAVPFLTPYLLGPLNLNHWQFMAVVSTALLARITGLPILSAHARSWGTRGLLVRSGVGLSLIPLLWLWSSAPLAYYLGVQVLTGFLMAAYDLALMFVYMEAIPAAQRTSVLTRFRLFDTLSMLGGSMIGGGLLLQFGSSLAAYKGLFALSCLARLLALKILPPAPTRSESGEWVTVASARAKKPRQRGVLRTLRVRTLAARRRPRSLVPAQRS